jgi:hypothetical protein
MTAPLPLSRLEREAIRDDAKLRATELLRVAATLWVDRDDATVMSELVVVLGQLRLAQETIKALDERADQSRCARS